MINFIDEDEKEIIESLRSDSWISDFNDDIWKKYEDYASNTIEFKNKVEVNLTDKDFDKIKIKAIEAGVPYQALISMLVHKYNEGKIGLNVWNLFIKITKLFSYKYFLPFQSPKGELKSGRNGEIVSCWSRLGALMCWYSILYKYFLSPIFPCN